MTDRINYRLPKVDVNKIRELTDAERDLVLGVLYTPVNGVGTVRATRPKISGKHDWLWRTMMMLCSPEEKFHSLSTSLDDYLYPYGEDRDRIEMELQDLADRMAETIKFPDWSGYTNWKNVMGG